MPLSDPLVVEDDGCDHAGCDRGEKDFARVVVAHITIAARWGVVAIIAVVDLVEATIVVTDAIALVPRGFFHDHDAVVAMVAMIVAVIAVVALVMAAPLVGEGGCGGGEGGGGGEKGRGDEGYAFLVGLLV